MSSVFLCHSSKDKLFVRSLASKLSERGIRVWLDEAEINIGESLSDKIGTAINQMSYFAIILSNNSIRSEWVKRELQVAIQKELAEKRVVILPLLLHKVDLPSFLKDKKYADFTNVHKFNKSFEQLFKVLMPIIINRSTDDPTFFDMRKAIRKDTRTHSQLDGNDIIIVNISEKNLGFLTNTELVYNDVRTIKVQHDYLSEIIKFVVTRPTLGDIDIKGFKFFVGAEILERSIQI